MARPMMTTYRNRGAAAIENDSLRVTVLEEGGHIAEIFDKHAGVNPPVDAALAVDRTVVFRQAQDERPG